MTDELELFLTEYESVGALRIHEEMMAHLTPRSNHEKDCLVCQKMYNKTVRNLLDVYFNLQGMQYWACINSYEQFTIKNFPPKEDWLDTECKLCNKPMTGKENCVGIKDCQHIFHTNCFYIYINSPIDFNYEKQCPVEGCDKKCFLSINPIEIMPSDININTL